MLELAIRGALNGLEYHLGPSLPVGFGTVPARTAVFSVSFADQGNDSGVILENVSERFSTERKTARVPRYLFDAQAAHLLRNR